ncbi:MAG: tRNA pseudouridine(38-40) synthase TruA [Chloroflexi bacterium]|nr:MAG: tRNA pseudouridine(38-40) synthase TruA [Chloroflexota bacterium]MBL1196674.1 tRNA pseudouridine(38-40) synthase TruA [Chloroflexota bacterium]NOH13967.1 tRNA pseudouridine(38-40) synthase TruA [Chloroflexota bacterium]
MARYKVILAYDGTDFSGFQRQTEARTVQAEVEKALSKIGWQGSSILAAGRTDAGVHAAGQVVAFDLDWKHADTDLLNAINATLPLDIAVQQVEQAAEDFHPRFDAKARRYRYSIFCQPQRDPLRERFAWRVWPEPELNELQKSAKLLIGSHDFASFGRPMKEGGSTIREVFETIWQREGDRLSFEVEANAFLYHMVRRMVMVQVEVGQGFRDADLIEESLDNPQDEIQGLGPPNGLSLIQVKYK